MIQWYNTIILFVNYTYIIIIYKGQSYTVNNEYIDGIICQTTTTICYNIVLLYATRKYGIIVDNVMVMCVVTRCSLSMYIVINQRFSLLTHHNNYYYIII